MSELETFAVSIMVLIIMSLCIFGVLKRDKEALRRDNKPFSSEDWAYTINKGV